MSKKVAKRILISCSITVATLFLVISGCLFYFYNNAKLDLDKLTFSNTGIKIYASENVNDSGFYNIDRKIIDIDDLHDYTINAFVDIEDKRFYEHNGYDLKRIAKSSLVNMKTHSKSQGASTITQQLVKNTLLTNEKTYKRKINEIMLAIKVEKNFTKKEILNMYLNSIYFGSNAYGIENASNVYFEKTAKDLTLNESAILAGLIKSPRLYSPRYNKEKCRQRKNLVLKQMLENGHISLDDYHLNTNLDVECASLSTNYDNTYFQQAIREACKILEISEKELIRDNYQIVTYIDDNVQKTLHNTLNSAYECDKLAIVATPTGEVLGYLGNSPYDLSDMKRTPASTLKPLAVYLPCINNNLCLPQTPILDDATTFSDYHPHNTNDEYSGWIDVEEALVQSKNIPSVKLLSELGVENSIQFLNKLGIKTSPNDHNLALGLGAITNGVAPVDLLSAYTVFANNGQVSKLHFVKTILNKNGRIIYQYDDSPKYVCDSESVYLTNKMLMQASKRGTSKLLSCFDFDIASKTGTNYVDGKTLDLWNIAYTSEHLSLCWLGSANNNGLSNLTSSFSATNLNKEILSAIYEKYKPQPFDIPSKIITCEIDLLELELNHKLKLASMYTPDRYKQIIEIKDDFDICNSDNFYVKPQTNLHAEIGNHGAEITFDTLEIFDYSLIKNNDTSLIDISNLNTTKTIIDDKIFSYDKVVYTLQIKNKYTGSLWEETYAIYPKEYLKNTLQFNIYSTKSRWYV